MADFYNPQTALEKSYFDILWVAANGGNPNEAPNPAVYDLKLSGKSAVPFFQKSGINVGFLKQIWSLSTPSASMSLQQFYTALRYITMIQSGEIPISKERLQGNAHHDIGLPKFIGFDLPLPGQGPPVAAAPPPAAAAPLNGPPGNFAITPQEHMKYHELFTQYDTDKDGYLLRDEAMTVLVKSKTDPNALQTIW